MLTQRIIVKNVFFVFASICLFVCGGSLTSGQLVKLPPQTNKQILANTKKRVSVLYH